MWLNVPFPCAFPFTLISMIRLLRCSFAPYIFANKLSAIQTMVIHGFTYMKQLTNETFSPLKRRLIGVWTKSENETTSYCRSKAVRLCTCIVLQIEGPPALLFWTLVGRVLTPYPLNGREDAWDDVRKHSFAWIKLEVVWSSGYRKRPQKLQSPNPI